MSKKRTGKTKHDKPAKGVFIAIDETSDYTGKYDIVVAAVTQDRRAYRDIVEKLDMDYEIGFSSDKELAPQVLGEAANLIDTIYAAYTPKENKDSYEKLLKAINKAIPYDPSKGLLVMVDANDTVDSHTVEKIFKSGKNEGDSSAVVVVPSNFFCEMQTHDFVTGAVGAKINHDNGKWMSYLLKVDFEPVKVKNRKGETSPTETPCPLAGLRVLPLRRQRTDACIEKRDTGIRSQNLGRGPAKTDNVGNLSCRYPATAGATQTSYGVRTNSPTRGLIGRTNTGESHRRYIIEHENGRWMKHRKGVHLQRIEIKNENRKRGTSPTETPYPLAGLRVRPLRGRRTDAYFGEWDTGIKIQDVKTGTQKRTGLSGRRKATGKKIGSVKR